MNLGNQIGHRIRELRIKQGLSQEQLATRADMEATFLSRIERGSKANIQINTLEKIIKALDIDYATFFSFENDDNLTNRIVAKLSLDRTPEETLQLFDTLLDWRDEGQKK